MRISIITVVLNAHNTVGSCIESVLSQSTALEAAGHELEYLVIDGLSTDGSMEVINSWRTNINQVVSEKDGGIYHAMNKGIELASGDVVGFLNADDLYQHESVLAQVAHIHSNPEVQACYADLVYVDKQDINKIIRNWKSQTHYPGLCFDGWMPAHPTLFLKADVFKQAGVFDTSLKYQSDLEFCARIFEIHEVKSQYVSDLWVRMRVGGVTNASWNTMLKGNWESYQALKKLGLTRNLLSYFSIKFFSRIKQYF